MTARIDRYENATGPIAALLRDLGIRSAIGAPIFVGGQLWGVMIGASTVDDVLPSDLEDRITAFTDIVSTAIANADSRAELIASRARVVAANDESRRRIERDLHDGAQQRLVTLALKLRSLAMILPPELEEMNAELSDVADGLEAVMDQLRELSHGIHPAILSKGGLGPALKALARRAPIPVDVDVRVHSRPSEQVEVAVYYVVAESLTNTAKHGQASVATVEVESRDRHIRVSISDDGIGGADLSRGSGLLGLRDRVDALGGLMSLTSPPGSGTSIAIELPMT